MSRRSPRRSSWPWICASTLACASIASPAYANEATIAQCIAANDQALDLRRQGKLLQSRKTFASCASPACGPEVSDACQKGIEEINKILPAIVFVPKNGAGEDVSGVQLSVDGAPTAHVIDGTALALDPGEHVFRFEAAGQAPVTKQFVLREGETNRTEPILIGPPPLPPKVPEAKPQAVEIRVVDVNAAPAQPRYDSTGNGQRIAGTIVLAVGLPVTIIGAAVEGILASTKWSAAQSDCKPGACGAGSQAQNEKHAAEVAATSADVWAIAAGVVLIGGIVLRVTAPRPRPLAAAAEVHIAPVPIAGGGALLLTGTFQ